jgi:hypothetical protein
MLVCDERCDCAFSTRYDGRAIAKLVYIDSFWEGVQEVYTVNEPLVKVLRLVNGNKLAMGYLYETMDRAKEAIRSYYVGKGTPEYEKYMMIWGLISVTKIVNKSQKSRFQLKNDFFSKNRKKNRAIF